MIWRGLRLPQVPSTTTEYETSAAISGNSGFSGLPTVLPIDQSVL